MTIVYRKADEEDARQLAMLRWEFKREEAEQALPEAASLSAFLDACEGFLREGIADGTWVHWIAEEAGQIMAVVSLQIVAEIPEPARLTNQYGCVTNVYTKPMWRRQGIGARLLTCAKESASQEGIEFLILWASGAAREFYARRGFISDGEAMIWQRE